VTDDLESMLRDHYRRAADRIEPDLTLITRARGAVSAPRRSRWQWPSAVAIATATVLIAVSALFTRPAGHQHRPLTAVAPATTVPGIHADRTHLFAGGRIRLTGTADGPLTVYLRIGGRWASSGTATGRHYSVEITVGPGTNGVRVCTRAACSLPIPLTVLRRPPTAAPMVTTPPARTSTPPVVPRGTPQTSVRPLPTAHRPGYGNPTPTP
jgi:hypothetical protein